MSGCWMGRISDDFIWIEMEIAGSKKYKPMQYNIHSPVCDVQDTEVILPQILRKDRGNYGASLWNW